MSVIVVANPKGGVGKTTLSTHVAGYLARRGHRVTLCDADRQQSAQAWLGLRPPDARPIAGRDVCADDQLRGAKGSTHLVVDTPAGLHGRQLKSLLKPSDRLLVPLQPGLFDILATRSFLDQLAQRKRAAEIEVAVVGMRVDPRTVAAARLRDFVEGLGLPVLGYLRDTQNYLRWAAQGLTLFDFAPERVARDLAQWRGICDWLDGGGAAPASPAPGPQHGDFAWQH